MELLRYQYDKKNKAYINLSAKIFNSLADRGLMGLSEVILSGIITEENNSIIFLIRNAIAYIDAMIASASLPSVESLVILSRSFFEAKCYCEYICKENTNQRAIAYQVKYIRDKIKKYNTYDLSTPQGREFEKKVSKDLLFADKGFPFQNTKEAIQNLEHQLTRSPYMEVNEYFNQNPKKEWYSIDSKKNCFCDLCDYLNSQIGYEYFYRQWSDMAHSASVYSGNIANINGNGSIEAIRSLEGYHDLTMITYSYIVQFYMEVFKKLVPKYYIRMLRYYGNQYRKLIIER